ncbi:hypothetical protein [Pantoea sp.]|uniref:hypothetical protein n=1 Tax=Pantoea sp. TaxID=69393 RepID=UPI00289C24EF|nr:hypothetical protein [Pantoea sp.]
MTYYITTSEKTEGAEVFSYLESKGKFELNTRIMGFLPGKFWKRKSVAKKAVKSPFYCLTSGAEQAFDRICLKLRRLTFDAKLGFFLICEFDYDSTGRRSAKQRCPILAVGYPHDFSY